jgi:hypothetical protein
MAPSSYFLTFLPRFKRRKTAILPPLVTKTSALALLHSKHQ